VINKIEVYVRKEKTLVGQYVSEPLSDGVMKHYCFSKKVLEYEKAMPEADKLALEVVNKFAEAKSLKVEVLDVSTLKGKLKASFKGIRKTPVVIVGRSRIEGEQTSKLLKSKLESCLAE
jgi:5,10-methylene-tetrahydrofolate dehydrogenase/methenyl tetrahydrofolate cyclohydrolase